MIYNFGQFRSSNFSDYTRSISYVVDDRYPVYARMPDSDASNTEFKFFDTAIKANLTALDAEKKMNSYYLRFKVYKQATPQVFDIKLIQNKTTNAITQLIDTITVDALSKDVQEDYETYEFIITPSDNHIFTGIHFELYRNLSDYQTSNDAGANGRIAHIEVESLKQITNILGKVGKQVLKQIGVQSVPGLLMSVNGEGIKVGRSGLYEITNGMPITFLGFIVENDDKYFILDYQY